MILILLVYFVPRVLSEMSLQHRVYMSRKSRSSSEPFGSEYTYNQLYNGVGPFSTFDTVMTTRGIGDESSPASVLESYRNSNEYLPTVQYTHPIDLAKRMIKTSSAMTSAPENDMSTIAKSQSKYNAEFLPSKIKTDAMYEQLKTMMHYIPPATEKTYGYETEYHIDDDDLRTSTREMHDIWPYYYHHPYEYEHNMRIDAEREKAKDKRYAVDAAKVIPIHEDLSDDIPNSQEPLFTTEYYKETSTDNPMSGHRPFFSFLLNDYFNKNDDYQDQLTFKEQDWGKGFDHEMAVTDIDVKRDRRLPNHHNIIENNSNIDLHDDYNKNEANAKGESVTEKGFHKKHEFDKHEKGDAEIASDIAKYQQNGQQYKGFKDFLDTFANKFGSEDLKKDSKYALKRNQDKGENRKGFRRVYHKDEYQEDNEFYDNNNSSAQSADKGSSNAHIGGSEALLKSHAFANIGNRASAYDNSGNKENGRFENNHKGYDMNNGLNNQFNRFRDVATKAAQSNSLDYSDNFTV